MLVNLLLQDGKSNYMEGLMCEFTFESLLHLLTTSDVPLPRHRSLLHCIIEQVFVERPSRTIFHGIYADHAHNNLVCKLESHDVGGIALLWT